MLWRVCSHMPTRALLPPKLHPFSPWHPSLLRGLQRLMAPVSFGFYPASNLTHLTRKPRVAGATEPINSTAHPLEQSPEQATLGSCACPDPASAGPKPSRHRPCHPVKEETLQQGPVGVKSLLRSPQKAAVELNQRASCWPAQELKIKLSCSDSMF